MESLYQTKAARREAANEAVVIHCGDHRFQNAFHEFLTVGLKLESYALLVIPGGGHFAAAELFMPKFAKVELQSLGFLVKRSGARRIVIFGHDDCLFFKERLQFFFTEEQPNQKQFRSLLKSRSVLCERFPAVAIEIYFADVADEGSYQLLKVE